MGWPQYVTLCWIVVVTVTQIYASVAVGQTHGQRTGLVLFDLARVAITVLVLSAGGFW